MDSNKFYQLKQRNACLGYFKRRSDAEMYTKLFNTKVNVCPIKIVEHEFRTNKEIKEDLKENV